MNDVFKAFKYSYYFFIATDLQTIEILIFELSFGFGQFNTRREYLKSVNQIYYKIRYILIFIYQQQIGFFTGLFKSS